MFLHKKNPHIIYYVSNGFLRQLCYLEHFEIVYWLMKLRKMRQIDYSYVFSKACKSKTSLRIIQMFYSSVVNVRRAFKNACISGRLDVVKWLEKEYPLIRKQSFSTVFCEVCKTGNLEMVKWFTKKEGKEEKKKKEEKNR